MLRGPRGGAQAPRHVYRRHRRRLRPAPHGLRGRRQRDRRGAGRLLRPRRGRAQRRRLGHGATTTAAASRSTSTRERASRRPRSSSPAPRRREVRPELLQGLGRPARRRRLGRQRALRLARSAHLAQRPRALHAVRDGGDPVAPLEVVGDALGRAGAAREVTFLPSIEVFTKTEFDFATLEHRLRELAFLNSGVRITLTDERGAEPQGRDAALRGRHRGLRPLPRPQQAGAAQPAGLRSAASGTASRSRSRCSGTTAITRRCLCFTNNIPQRDGGTHLAGLPRRADAHDQHLRRRAAASRSRRRSTLAGEDMREGLTCVLSVKMPDPKFSLADQGQAGLAPR